VRGDCGDGESGALFRPDLLLGGEEILIGGEPSRSVDHRENIYGDAGFAQPRGKFCGKVLCATVIRDGR